MAVNGDLHARLLAEIEQRTAVTYSVPRNIVARNQILALMQGNLGYLAALRAIVDLHASFAGGCHECEYDWPCETLLAVGAALGVTP